MLFVTLKKFESIQPCSFHLEYFGKTLAPSFSPSPQQVVVFVRLFLLSGTWGVDAGGHPYAVSHQTPLPLTTIIGSGTCLTD